MQPTPSIGPGPIVGSPIPPWASVQTAGNADELQSLMGGLASQRAGILVQPARLRYERVEVWGQQVFTGFARSDSTLVIRGQVFEPVLHLCTVPGGQYRVGRRRIDIQPGRQAVLVPADVEITRWVPPGRTTVVSIGKWLVEAEILRRSASETPKSRATFGAWTFDTPVRSAWAAAVARHVQANRPGSDPQHLVHAEEVLASLMVDLVLAQGAPARTGALDARRLARVESWVDAHLGDAITLGRLCQVAGVGARCLQKSFEARRGVSPMRFVAERRLLEAHRRLSREEPLPSIKSVALDLGFHHLGRFADAYRQLVGEVPSATRAARLAQTGPAAATSEKRTPASQPGRQC